MESNWASEHLQVIRTLMERSALYRRALAPVMSIVGTIGVAAAIVPCFADLKETRAFAVFWIGVSLVAAIAAFLLVRRQALKEAEPVWSLPTRRVIQALAPGFVIGLVTGALAVVAPTTSHFSPTVLAIVWILAYGCAVNAAGFFMQRGIKLLGWLFEGAGVLLVIGFPFCPWLQTAEAAHYLMGGLFGLLHLAYGIYLYFTEKAKNSA